MDQEQPPNHGEPALCNRVNLHHLQRTYQWGAKQTSTSLLGLKDDFSKVLQYENKSFLNDQWLQKLAELVTRLTRAPKGVWEMVKHTPFTMVRRAVSMVQRIPAQSNL